VESDIDGKWHRGERVPEEIKRERVELADRVKVLNLRGRSAA